MKLNLIEDAIATLGITGSIAVGLLIIFAILQLLGEFIEACGKVAPAVMKLRKVISKAIHKKKAEQEEITNTLKEVKTLLSDVNSHYSKDNITMRDDWIAWVNNKADLYDEKVAELIELKQSLNDIVTTLAENTKTTDNLFKESCRETIINFSHRAMNPMNLISEEEFKRVFNVYEQYEAFLKARKEPNGQVETCYSKIKEAYAKRLETNDFIEYKISK